MNKPRLVMIGWDGADQRAVESWLQQGVLPTLESLRKRGVWGSVASLPGLGDDACWGSFSTGTEPATHGRFHYRQIVPGSYRLGSFFRDRMTGEPFWSQVSSTGRRVAILDVPKSPLAKNLNGIQIADWLPHGEDGPEPVSWPPALASELPAHFRPRPGFTCHRVRTGVTEFLELRDRIREHLALRAALAREWWRQERWDFFLAVFAESHCIGHHFWHLHDPDHPQHDRATAEMFGDPVREIHQSLDEGLGALLTECGPDTTVIVFSLLGMGPNYMGTWLTDRILRRLEDPHRKGSRLGHYLATRVMHPANRLPVLPHSIRTAIANRAFSTRTAFVVHSDAASTAIRLNVIGREPRGTVQPDEYDACCHFLAENFRALVDPDDGRPLVSEVVPVAERYPGPHTSAYADLLVIWNMEAPIRAAKSASIGVIRGEPPADRSGNHRKGGWFVAAGPGIKPGKTSDPVAIIDFAPTAAAILGVNCAGMKGTPIRAMIQR